MPSINDDFIFDVLPEGLSTWFEIERYEKTTDYFRIYLTEKNIPPETHGKRIINTVMKSSTIDDFPIRGRKVELVVKRRYWKLESVDTLIQRKIELSHPNTRLEKEFAAFLKDAD